MNKLFILGFAFIFLLSFSFALSFPGKTLDFKDLNLPTVYENDVCIPFNLSVLNKDLLLNTPGVLGLFLHIKSGNPEDFFYIQSDKGIVYSRNNFGFGVEHRNFVSDSQQDYLFINLESVRSVNLDLYFCVSSKNKLELFNDSQIGSYRIPYFGEKNFTKSFKNPNEYKLNEKSPVEVVLKNSGFGNADVFLFYDNEIFTKWFKLKDGVPSITKTLAPGEEISLEYNIEPSTDKSFTVSPAIARYTFNDYVFTEVSNGLISNARAYLDEIFVNVNLSETNLDLNETGVLQVVIYNDSNKDKDAVLLVQGLEKFGLDDRYQIVLKPFETKNLFYNLSSSTEKIVTFNVSMIAGDNQKTEKTYDTQTIYFGHGVNNYTYIYVVIAVVLVAGLVVYYRFAL